MKKISKLSMHSIRTKFTSLTVIAIIGALSIATLIGVISISRLGRSDAEQMLHLMCSTGAMNLESYFDSVEHSTETVASLVQDSLEEAPPEELESQVERARNLFGKVAYNTNGVLTYYFRIDPEVSDDVKGFWYVNEDGEGFREHEVTDISQYDTDDTSSLVWFTVPKATGEGIWLPPYYTENLDVRVISYNVPVYRYDQFIGVIGIEIDYGTLAKEVENIKLFDHGYAFILDENSNVIYHPLLDSKLHYGEKIALNEPDKVLGENHIQYNYEGVEKEAVWLPLSNGMRLYVTVPVKEINRGWTSLVRNILIASLVILLIVVFLMMRFTGRLTKPLTELTKAAKQVDEGNYDYALDYEAEDEVGALTSTFRFMRDRLKASFNDLNSKAYKDALTGVRNKAAYDSFAEGIDLSVRTKESGSAPEYAVILMDCDGLKTINDLYGHDKGDIFLCTACRLICQVYAHSPVFRIGGDEFVVLLQGEDYRRREELLSEFEQRCCEINEKAADPWDKVCISKGMAVFRPGTDADVNSVLHHADDLMYEEKKEHKENDTVTSDEHEPEDMLMTAGIPVINVRKRILIAEDVEIQREMLGDLLRDDYDITFASDGTEALEALRSSTDVTDLVLLDLYMPNMNGREVLKEMQVDEELRDVPVIVLTTDQESELDCLKIGAMDFIPKPYPDIEIIKARINKCIELSEDRDLIRHTERDKLTGLLNKDYFFRYVDRLDHIYRDTSLDAVACGINDLRSVNRQQGRLFGDYALRSIGAGIRKLARKTGGIGGMLEGGIFLLYCPHQDDYEELLKEFTAEVFAGQEEADTVSLRFGIFADAQTEPDIEERFVRAQIAADRVKDDPQKTFGFY